MNAFLRTLPSGSPDGAHASIPEVHLLSNGSYHVMMTSAGGGCNSNLAGVLDAARADRLFAAG